MAGFNRSFVLVAVAAGLAAAISGCAQKVPDSHWAGERPTWRGWQGTWDEMTGWREWAGPSIQAKYNTPKGEPGCTLWMDPQYGQRVTSQNGVNDYLDYSLCPDSPYPAYLGTRMTGRP